MKELELWTSMASILGAIAFFQGIISTIFPPNFRFSIVTFISRIISHFSSYCYFDITELDGGITSNELYNAVQLYLSSSCTSSSSSTSRSSPSSRLSLTRAANASTVTFSLSSNETMTDVFNGVTLRWDHTVSQRTSTQSFSWRPLPEEKRGFALRLRKADRERILLPYLDHIVAKAAEIRRLSEERFLYTNSRAGAGYDSARPGPWEAVPFKHPSTFDTLALETEKKREIMEDLKEFAGGESFYKSTGRAWKRGYLLYGPPGTGKSSMIAAIANYLNYDIYDLELTEVGSNSELRKLLMKTTSKSVIVIEDIDCSVNLTGSRKKNNEAGVIGHPISAPYGADDVESRRNTITLSGLLNFTDGLWSSCGNERIFVFTTNHVDKLDPALLRSGRMDMHIHMSYCTFDALKILLKNYIGYESGNVSGKLMGELEGVVEKARMTPADVSEVLIRHRRKEKVKVVGELLEEMRRRGETKWRANREEDVQEEQEKRELLEMCNNEVGKEDTEKEDLILDCSTKSQDDEAKKFK